MKTIINKSVISFIVLSLFFSMAGCGNQSKTQLKSDLTNTIEAMLGRDATNKIYISGVTFIDKASHRVLLDNEVGTRICELIEYSIESIDITGKNATAVITVKSPDVYQMLSQIVKDTTISDTESLLKELLSQLNSQANVIEETISCNLEYKNEHWYLITNSQLSNMLSGNLYEYYANLGKNTVDELTGGIKNEK